MKKLLLTCFFLVWALPAHAQNPLFTTVTLGPLAGPHCKLSNGSAAPNSAVTGSPCDIYLQSTGMLWLKVTGTSTNTGWSSLSPACSITGGNIVCYAPTSGAGTGGDVNITSGDSGVSAGAVGNINITTGVDNFLGGAAGVITINVADSSVGAVPGYITITSGKEAACAACGGNPGGLLSLTAGAGQGVTGGTPGGVGGVASLVGGAGGVNSSTIGSPVGGIGGAAKLISGVGGNATGSSGTRTGGAGGNVIIQASLGGTGASANGAPGVIELIAGGVTWTWPITDGLLNYVLATNGSGGLSFIAAGSGGLGTVTSVGLSMPAALCTLSGSPVTTSGTLTCGLPTETANTVWAGPTTGSAAAPTFRALVGADLPAPGASSLGGIESLTCTTNQFIKQISTGGVPSCGTPSATAPTYTFGFTTDGSGTALTTGIKGFEIAPAACTINSVTVLSTDNAVTSGSIVIDVWKAAYSSWPPTVSNTITASDKPTLSSATHSQDTTLTGWTTSVSAGDVFGYHIDSVSTLTRVSMFMACQ
jgi:hypothetical protein